MKNKLTVNSLAHSNLKARKKQYAFMIIGIILAMIFSSGILFFASCVSTSRDEMLKNSYGAQDAIFMNANEELFKKAKEEGFVTDYGFAHIIGFGYTDEEENGTSVAYLDDKAKALSYISFIEGAYPEKENEIAIEKATLARLGLDAKIGDIITLSVLPQNGSELMSKPVEKSYKLTGIVTNKRSNIMNSIVFDDNTVIASAFVKAGTQTELGGKERLFAYFNYDLSGENRYNDFDKFLVANGSGSDEWMECGYKDAGYGRSTGDIQENIGFIIVFVIILLIASCVGIINAFSSNLNDRKKQIGMLRTVGATKRQIITIFGREAFIISLICAPISVLISYLAVKGVAKLMGDAFVFLPNWWVLILCALFSVACVMLAALVPLGRASRISPIQSIRNIDITRKMKTKHIKTQKSFNVSKLLAGRNITFNRRSHIIVSIIIVITIVFSCFGFSYMNFAKEDYYFMSYDYQVYMSFNNMSEYMNLRKSQAGFTEKDKQKALSIPYVKSVNATRVSSALICTDLFTDYMKTLLYGDFSVYNDKWFEYYDKLTPENIDELISTEYSQNYLELREKYNITQHLFPSEIIAYDADVLSRLESSVIDGKINMDKINSGEEIILFAPEKVAFGMEKEKNGGYSFNTDRDDNIDKERNYLKKAESDYKAGDKIDLSILTADEMIDNGDEYGLPDDCDIMNKTVTIGAIISEFPDSFYGEGTGKFYANIRMLTSLSGMNFFIKDMDYSQFNITLKTECDEEMDAEIQEVLTNIADSVYGGNVTSNYELVNNQRKSMNSLFFSMISIMVLFLCISASIINNSMSARIRESKREIGTLRAVGASQTELVSSYIRQLLSLFGWSYLIGFALYFILLGVLTIVTKSQENPVELKVMVWQTIIACIVLFAVCAINLWLKIKKEIKNSIIDNIREL